MCLAIGLSRSAIPYGSFAISQVEKRGFGLPDESQLKIPSGPFPHYPVSLKMETTQEYPIDFAEDSFLLQFQEGDKGLKGKLYEVQPAG